jgi:uncharacterized protein (TIGR00251 family)
MASDHTTLVCKITPNARKSECSGWGRDEQGRPVLLVKISAPAVEGKANKELIRFMADYLECSKNEISLLKGEVSRTKVLFIPSEAAARLR